MNITPLFDRVVLVNFNNEKTSSIILPSEHENIPGVGEVYAVSNEIINSDNDIKIEVGNKVLYNKYASSEFLLEGKKYILIKQTDILAIIKN